MIGLVLLAGSIIWITFTYWSEEDVPVGPFESRSKLSKAQDILVQMNYQPLVISRQK